AGKSSMPGSPARSGATPSRTPAESRPSLVSRPSSEAEPSTTRQRAVSPFGKPSPFEADRNRKTGPKAEAQTGFTAPDLASAGADVEPATSSAAKQTGTATAVVLDAPPDPQAS